MAKVQGPVTKPLRQSTPNPSGNASGKNVSAKRALNTEMEDSLIKPGMRKSADFKGLTARLRRGR